MSNVATQPNVWETRHIGFEGRAEIGEDRKIRGYAVVFNSLSLDLGGFRELVEPSAVDRTLREGLDVRAYFNHDQGLVLGRRSAGTLQLRKDGHGLAVEITPPDTTMAKDLVKSIKRGDISGMSFRFRTIEDAWDFKSNPPTRSLVDMVIGEVSVVSEPAYPATDVAVRSLSEARTAMGLGRDRAWFERRVRAVGA